MAFVGLNCHCECEQSNINFYPPPLIPLRKGGGKCGVTTRKGGQDNYSSAREGESVVSFAFDSPSLAEGD